MVRQKANCFQIQKHIKVFSVHLKLDYSLKSNTIFQLAYFFP